MCDLCSEDPEEKRKAVEHNHRIAERLYILGALYNDMASGRISPHGEVARNYQLTARSVIRSLVEDWV